MTENSAVYVWGTFDLNGGCVHGVYATMAAGKAAAERWCRRRMEWTAGIDDDANPDDIQYCLDENISVRRYEVRG